MNDIIIDSCVAAKWILPETDSEKAVVLYQVLTTGDKRPVMLDVGLTEVANAIWKRVHRGLMSCDEAYRSLEDLLSITLRIRPAKKYLQKAMEIAVKYDLSVYDALFVALADHLQLTGVTADEPLWTAIHEDHPNIALLRDWKP